MPRHPSNTNLHLLNGSEFEGLPIQADKGPFVIEYLHILRATMANALGDYPRVFAFRVDPRLPAGMDLSDDACTNTVIKHFIESFKAKLKHAQHVAAKNNIRVHNCKVRYVWAREVGSHGRPHYHLLFLLNQEAFHTLGKRDSVRDNMCSRLDEAWASALGLPLEAVSGLIHVPDNAVYYLRRDDAGSQAELFNRASYLCKAATKVYGDGQHAFGASRL
ncbi:inovirus Gp2 family protein [Pseudomonas frederiksbergensis]|uniref:inovirus Gp2 family protein n=1 Tax=Pseudomonas frederiksbergensis TaxID=104087 RepID=UPI000F4AEA74|nr:inovirus Gp2 family protein [Pseudomonas frederiksbergensis]RON49544.1 transposase [Pseudomonas frederiksbergensis]